MRFSILPRRRAAGAVEFGLLVGLVAVAIIGATVVMGSSIAALFGQTANRINPDRAGSEAQPVEPPAADPASLSLAGPDVLPRGVGDMPGDCVAVTLSNDGGETAEPVTLTLSSPAEWCDPAAAAPCDVAAPFALPAGQSCDLSIRAAANPQTDAATLVATINAELAAQHPLAIPPTESLTPGDTTMTVSRFGFTARCSEWASTKCTKPEIHNPDDGNYYRLLSNYWGEGGFRNWCLIATGDESFHAGGTDSEQQHGGSFTSHEHRLTHSDCYAADVVLDASGETFCGSWQETQNGAYDHITCSAFLD